MVYYSWERIGIEVLDCELSGDRYMNYFVHSPNLKWRRQMDYVPKEDPRSKRVPDLYLTLKGVPQYEENKKL